MNSLIEKNEIKGEKFVGNKNRELKVSVLLKKNTVCKVSFT